MNNLHRELAPVSDAAWAGIEQEARRTFTLHVAGRRVVDVAGPDGPEAAAVGTGHLADVASPGEGVLARVRASQPVVELDVPFSLSREAIDDVGRGAKDPDWQPVKDAATRMAFAEDRAVFQGFAAAGIGGVAASSPHPALALPPDVRDYPDAVSAARTSLLLAGVGGPYALVLPASAYTAVNETSDYGYPVAGHLARMVGEIVWAPAVTGTFLLSTRGGDYELRLGEDLSIGYLSHDAASVRLYFHQSLTFLVHTAEAGIVIGGAAPGQT